jgi:uncharacterized protein (DUF58 family)
VIYLVVTRRFIWLIAAGTIAVLAGYFIGAAVQVFILYNFICFLILIVDFNLTPPSDIFDVERTGDHKLSIYEKENIIISIYNKSDHKFVMQLKDTIPDFHFVVPNKIVTKGIPPHNKMDFVYEVIPQKRGAFIFGSLNIRYISRLGLCMKSFTVPMDREYKVYPNLKALRKYHMTACSNRKFKSGLKSMKMLGRGTSFESLREYIPGDEYRRINWKATARESKPIINQYEPEKDQHVYALIDSGRPMSYSVRGYNKLDMAINTALILSDIVNQNGDKSGLLVFNTQLQGFISPGKGSDHRNKMMEALYHIKYTNYTSNYEDTFLHLKKYEKHRSIIFLFTDFDTIEEADEMQKLLHLISRNNIVIIMLIKNESLERISETKAGTEEEIFNKAVAMELLTERKNIIKSLNKLGIMCIECEIENIEITSINKYIEVKNRKYF